MMQDSQTTNAIRVNHVGFMKHAAKHFMIEHPPENNFRVEYLYHTAYQTVYEGILQFEEGEQGSGWVGCFSPVTEEGNYRICCGDLNSRLFVIWDKAHDTTARVLLNYFTWQRCGHPLGWAGLCHQDDGYIAETGEHIDLTGGYHQSCDLRKSPGGVSIGVLGLVKYALLDKPLWGMDSIPDEVRWACDYYVKSIQPNGCMYNTLNDPLGWAGREFYQSGAPANAQWNVMRILTMGSAIIQDRAELYLRTARRMWNYMVNERPDGPYRHPAASLPRGMDPESFYAASFKGSTADISTRLSAAADFYRVTGEDHWLDEVTNMANVLCVRFVGGDDQCAACLLVDEDTAEILDSAPTYGWLGGGTLSLCDALELLPDSDCAPKWRGYLDKAAQRYVTMSEKNIWRLPASFYSDADLDKTTGHPAPGRKLRTKREQIDKLYPAGTIKVSSGEQSAYYRFITKARVSVLSNGILMLRRAAVILAEPELDQIAQRQLDYIFGSNPFDATPVESVGYNQTALPAYGQFFPSTPQIPGAINVGFTANNHQTDVGAEYDMPLVGFLLWVLGDMAAARN